MFVNLEEYLQALKDCPNEKLQEELGPYDNYPILINGNYEYILDLLLSSKWVHRDQASSEKRIKNRRETIRRTDTVPIHTTNIWLNYTELPVAVAVSDRGIYVNNLPSVNQDSTLKRLRDENFYNGTIVLHVDNHKDCNLSKRKLLDEQTRDVASVIEYTTRILAKNDMPFCLPVIGRIYNDPDIISKRIVYYP